MVKSQNKDQINCICLQLHWFTLFLKWVKTLILLWFWKNVNTLLKKKKCLGILLKTYKFPPIQMELMKNSVPLINAQKGLKSMKNFVICKLLPSLGYTLNYALNYTLSYTNSYLICLEVSWSQHWAQVTWCGFGKKILTTGEKFSQKKLKTAEIDNTITCFHIWNKSLFSLQT